MLDFEGNETTGNLFKISCNNVHSISFKNMIPHCKYPIIFPTANSRAQQIYVTLCVHTSAAHNRINCVV